MTDRRGMRSIDGTDQSKNVSFLRNRSIVASLVINGEKQGRVTSAVTISWNNIL